MAGIFVVNYVFLYFTVTVDDEYSCNARNPGPVTARNSIVLFRTCRCSDRVECMVVPSSIRSDNYMQQETNRDASTTSDRSKPSSTLVKFRC